MWTETWPPYSIDNDKEFSKLGDHSEWGKFGEYFQMVKLAAG